MTLKQALPVKSDNQMVLYSTLKDMTDSVLIYQLKLLRVVSVNQHKDPTPVASQLLVIKQIADGLEDVAGAMQEWVSRCE